MSVSETHLPISTQFPTMFLHSTKNIEPSSAIYASEINMLDIFHTHSVGFVSQYPFERIHLWRPERHLESNHVPTPSVGQRWKCNAKLGS